MTATEHLLVTLREAPGHRLLVTAERGTWQVRDTRFDARLPRRYSDATATRLFDAGQIEDITGNHTAYALTPEGTS